MSIPGEIEHFIGGRHVPSADGATFRVADPVSNSEYARGGRRRGRRRPRDAFENGPWPGLAAQARARIMNKIADGIEVRGEQIAALETFDTGLPVTQAKGQAARAAENFRYFADVIVAQHLPYPVLHRQDPGCRPDDGLPRPWYAKIDCSPPRAFGHRRCPHRPERSSPLRNRSLRRAPLTTHRG